MVNGQIYSSEFISTDSGSVDKVMFALKECNAFQPYFGMICFFLPSLHHIDTKHRQHQSDE